MSKEILYLQFLLTALNWFDGLLSLETCRGLIVLSKMWIWSQSIQVEKKTTKQRSQYVQGHLSVNWKYFQTNLNWGKQTMKCTLLKVLGVDWLSRCDRDTRGRVPAQHTCQPRSQGFSPPRRKALGTRSHTRTLNNNTTEIISFLSSILLLFNFYSTYYFYLLAFQEGEILQNHF